MEKLQRWRERHGLTQVEASGILGVSQAYLSLLEKGARPMTAAVKSRMQFAEGEGEVDERFPSKLSALGYAGFADVRKARPKPRADELLISILAEPNVDGRVAEALPWLVRCHAGQMNLDWLVSEAKLGNLQNRLGYVLEASGVRRAEVLAAIRELDRARLIQEATLCWDAMEAGARAWMRIHRTALARHWNLLERGDGS